MKRKQNYLVKKHDYYQRGMKDLFPETQIGAPIQLEKPNAMEKYDSK